MSQSLTVGGATSPRPQLTNHVVECPVCHASGDRCDVCEDTGCLTQSALKDLQERGSGRLVGLLIAGVSGGLMGFVAGTIVTRVIL